MSYFTFFLLHDCWQEAVSLYIMPLTLTFGSDKGTTIFDSV